MRWGKGLFVVGVLVAFAIFAVPAFAAATATSVQSRIAKDLADGRLDGTYTKSQLSAYFKNATVQGYPSTPKNSVAGTVVAQSGVKSAKKTSGTLPFTGADLALVTAGGIVLVGVGFGMRRLGRKRS